MAKPKQAITDIPQLRLFLSGELPPPWALALLAAVLSKDESQQDDPLVAFGRAVRFYSEMATLSRIYPKCSPFDRAVMCGSKEHELKEAIYLHEQGKYWPPTFPATGDDFITIVVPGKTKADRYRNVREYFRSICPADQDPDEWAAEQIRILKDQGFGSQVKNWDLEQDTIARLKWNGIAEDFQHYWRKRKSKTLSNNKKGKRKKR